MISILIPTYNVICVNLVERMTLLAAKCGKPYEILLADDASPLENVRVENSKIEQWECCRYIQLHSNVGPAKIRNILGDEAKYDCLLFLDSDTIPVEDNFLELYISCYVSGGVICGGFKYPSPQDYNICPLRYKYGIKVETASASVRSKEPYTKFIGMNFCIDKRVFEKVRFDESMHFGYEDAYFGGVLKINGIKIYHIDNPVWHLSQDSSVEYLAKIRKSVENLWTHKEKMYVNIRLLEMWRKLDNLCLTRIIALIFRVTEPVIIRNLIGKYPSVYVFAFYKLGYLCSVIKNHSQQ